MKTKLTYLFILVLMLLPAACGDKETPPQEYTANEITLMVPGNWLASYQEAEQQIVLQAPQDEYALGIQILETSDITAEEFAGVMSKELGGKTPQPSDEYGDYQFSCAIMDFPANVNILTKDGYSMVMVEIGPSDKYAEQIDAVMRSMKSSNPNFQNVINAIKFKPAE